MLIRLENGVPVEHPIDDYNFRTAFPGVSFPSCLTPADVEAFGYGLYEYTQQPVLDKYQKMVEDVPIKKDNGIWYQQWKVVEMSDEEKGQADSFEAEKIRGIRLYKLMMSDWTQFPDAPVDGSVWLEYRQALRDVPSQSGFPWDVVWPAEPV
jgi:hypothetical protein